MADPLKIPMSTRIAGALPYALPVLGGTLGIVFVNMTPEALRNPLLWGVIGAVVGRVLAYGIVKVMLPGSVLRKSGIRKDKK